MPKEDFEMDFLKVLHEMLKDQVVGKVYTDIVNDELYVEISNDMYTWNSRTNNFFDRFVVGWTPSSACAEIVQMYKRHILNRYFRKGASR